MARTLEHLAKEAFRRSGVALGREQEINRLSGGVDRPIQVLLLAADLYVVSSTRYDLFVGLRYGRQRLSNSGEYTWTQRNTQVWCVGSPRSRINLATCR